MIREGLAVGGPPEDPRPPLRAPTTPSANPEQPGIATPVPAPIRAPKRAPVKIATGAEPATAAPQAQPKGAAPGQKAATQAIAAPGKKLGPDGVEKVIAHLREHAKGRPTKRAALERHVVTILGGKLSPEAACSLVADLERAGAVEFAEKQIHYKLPKAKQ
jgi:hypothetical protein